MTAADLKKGARVRHVAAPQWGIGELLRDPVGGKAWILFVDAGEKLIMLSNQLLLVEGAEAENALLDRRIESLGIDSSRVTSRNHKIGHTRNQKPRRPRLNLTLGELKSRFLQDFPGGFRGQKFHSTERDYKIAAHKLAREWLHHVRFQTSRHHDAIDAICRDASQILHKTNLVFKNELIKFHEGLKSQAGKREFVTRLCELLFGQSDLEHRFMAFCDFLSDIGAPNWTTATYFPFIMFPGEYMFMKPRVTIVAAEICDFELNYKPRLNWLTYHCLLTFAVRLKEQLEDLEPRDFIDVQSFIWCMLKDLVG
ncbi:MAG TPA: DUF3553 domain-containing protein [Candidatus Binataceae bacterium]|nr:DUF3553 domain-containing protein [Candidatus Binataceae bacterium]